MVRTPTSDCESGQCAGQHHAGGPVREGEQPGHLRLVDGQVRRGGTAQARVLGEEALLLVGGIGDAHRGGQAGVAGRGHSHIKGHVNVRKLMFCLTLNPLQLVREMLEVVKDTV